MAVANTLGAYLERLSVLRDAWFVKGEYGPFRIEVSEALNEKLKGPYRLNRNDDVPCSPTIRARLLDVSGIEGYIVDDSFCGDEMRLYPCHD
jgi:hypothetical protein